jgi:hypothetical protein
VEKLKILNMGTHHRNKTHLGASQTANTSLPTPLLLAGSPVQLSWPHDQLIWSKDVRAGIQLSKPLHKPVTGGSCL